MNLIARTTLQLINQHGIEGKYLSITPGVYDINTSTVSDVTTEYTVKIYMKHIRANQFNYPTLVGKDAGLFYIAKQALSVIPKMEDAIKFNGATYSIDSIQSHAGNGEIILYRIIGIK